MTTNVYILPMSQARRIVFIVYDGFELLDLSGPAAVYSTANALTGEKLYKMITGSAAGGGVASHCGITVATSRSQRLRIGKADTVLVTGAYGYALRVAMRNKQIANLLNNASIQAERFGSVCSGAFLLGAAGLLEGKRVATHWSACARLRTAFDGAAVESNALYVVDGRLWTSAGVTTGIDMALAMLARDHGSRLMGLVAKQLVVYAHRPGHQSQFSALLAAQSTADGAFSDLSVWLESKLGEPIKVADMARRVAMSERTFHRKFAAATGVTPSKYVESLRLERAKRYLELNERVKAVAARVGFKSESAFRTAFRAQFGITPRHHSRMHAAITWRGTNFQG
jgi:transcriptional regulator GlxA family with amidase domain